MMMRHKRLNEQTDTCVYERSGTKKEKKKKKRGKKKEKKINLLPWIEQ